MILVHAAMSSRLRARRSLQVIASSAARASDAKTSTSRAIAARMMLIVVALSHTHTRASLWQTSVADQQGRHKLLGDVMWLSVRHGSAATSATGARAGIALPPALNHRT